MEIEKIWLNKAKMAEFILKLIEELRKGSKKSLASDEINIPKHT